MKQNMLYEAVRSLMSQEKHVSLLAKSLKINQMQASRILKKLLEENAVDYKIEGKNKIYFIKKTLEARNYVYLAETYALNYLLRKHKDLRFILREVFLRKDVKIVLLFGSYAKGLERQNSDIDIYVDSQDFNLEKEFFKYDERISVKVSPFSTDGILMSEVIRNHVVLKGLDDYYDKLQFFKDIM